MTLLLILGSLLCGVAVVLMLQEVFLGRTRRRTSLRRVVSYASAHQELSQKTPEKRPGILDFAVPALSRVALKLTPRVELNELQLRIAAAGLGGRINPQQFLALKTVFGVIALVVGFGSVGLNGRGFLFAFVLVVASRMLPDFALKRLARNRAERLSAHLPGAIDQIVVSLEAGLGFDAAVSYFVRRGRSPLTAELRIMLREMQMGEARAEALKRLAERVPSDEMRSFVQTLVQSEGVGMSRTQILRNQAADLRTRWQLAAEEKAQKAPVKMLFPIVIFILPVMFIVILGPAINQVSRLWGG
jgi:tight adherence protein C